MDLLAGREDEQQIVKRTLASNESEFVAVYGRRRVGKTYLIRESYGNSIVFELVGAYQASADEQLQLFALSMQRAMKSEVPIAVPKSWIEAFYMLEKWLEKKKGKQKKVIFLDELPWLDTRKSGMLNALEQFWNGWASKRKDIVLVVCGSAASWMQRKLIQAKGGLHNRITRHISLQPFTFHESEDYLKRRKVKMSRYQMVELYMALGGIPHYLKEVKAGDSSAMAVDRICFSKNGILRDEFDRLYKALFENADCHEEVVRLLSKKRMGFTRNEIIENLKLASGGTLTKILKELIECGFVMSSNPYQKKKKDALYWLSDEFTMFYFKWMDKSQIMGKGSWLKKQNSQSWQSWSGYAFEMFCLKHIDWIKDKLGISAVDADICSWRYTPKNSDESGAQIDLLLDRADNTINLCEMKFSNTEFTIDKAYAKNLRNKLEVFRRITGTKKSIMITLVTPYGIRENEYKKELVATEVVLCE